MIFSVFPAARSAIREEKRRAAGRQRPGAGEPRELPAGHPTPSFSRHGYLPSFRRPRPGGVPRPTSESPSGCTVPLAFRMTRLPIAKLVSDTMTGPLRPAAIPPPTVADSRGGARRWNSRCRRGTAAPTADPRREGLDLERSPGGSLHRSRTSRSRGVFGKNPIMSSGSPTLANFFETGRVWLEPVRGEAPRHGSSSRSSLPGPEPRRYDVLALLASGQAFVISSNPN